ncbi:hypothetical protein CIB48_g3316 [Xylaria polymorpha]|nr:hypothetical protein CIB48_g3316 [Xylaria polymorpha]
MLSHLGPICAGVDFNCVTFACDKRHSENRQDRGAFSPATVIGASAVLVDGTSAVAIPADADDEQEAG